MLGNPDPQLGFGSDAGVVRFNFKKHFNGPSNVYTDYVCPPPKDFTETPNTSTSPPSCSNGPAVFARAGDHSHLSPAGEFTILQPYIEGCVKGLLGVTGGDTSKCS